MLILNDMVKHKAPTTEIRKDKVKDEEPDEFKHFFPFIHQSSATLTNHVPISVQL